MSTAQSTDFSRRDTEGKNDVRELLDSVALQGLLNDLYELTGFSLAIVDTHGDILLKTGWQDICEVFHLKNQTCKENCLLKKNSLVQDTKPGEFKLVRCKNNLWIIATPLWVGGQHRATLFFGQFFFEGEEIAEEQFKKQAQKYGFDVTEYLKALAKVPFYSHEQVAQIMNFLTKMANMISSMNHNRIMMEKHYTEKQKYLEMLTLHSTALDQISDGVSITDMQGIITYVNLAQCTTSGFQKEELVGKHISIFGSEPESEASQEEILAQTLNKGSYEGVIINRSKQGEKISTFVRTNKVNDAFGNPIALCATSSDISDRINRLRQMEFQGKIDTIMQTISKRVLKAMGKGYDEILQLALSEFGELLNLDRCSIFKLSDNGMMINNTHEWCKEGIIPEKENLQGIPCSLTVKILEHFNTQVMMCFNDLEALPEEFRPEIDLFKWNNVQSVLAFPVFVQNNFNGFLGFMVEKSKRSWTERERKIIMMAANLVSNISERSAFETELVYAKSKAEESDRLKSTFLAIVNHELRTPLNHIMGFAQLIQGNADEEERDEYVAKIQESGHKLLGIIKSIFELALGEENEINAQAKLFTLKDHLESNQQQLRRLLRDSGKQHNINLIFDIEPNLTHLHIFADESKINIILHNLFKNAVKFTESGSITFGCEAISTQMLRYWIKDTGIGISKESEKGVFGLFTQSEDANTRKYDGMGIGLAISNKLADVLGGRIYWESTKGFGSDFFFEVPVFAQNQPLEGRNSKLSGEFNHKQIMIVDDDVSIVMLFRHYLEQSGAVLHSAHDGEEAVDSLNSLPAGSIILMDLSMPVLDGFAATTQIKKQRPDIKIVALSGVIQDADDPSILRSGFDAVLPKPVSKEQILNCLRSLI
ncbi:MAG: PocR ligand-binding domain-containing protein [Candidatus Cloacimonetes bacterium]|nr:PocR ligand-binding domain-containing protein [Candidatus Cloacimonadota bacterium]